MLSAVLLGEVKMGWGEIGLWQGNAGHTIATTCRAVSHSSWNSAWVQLYFLSNDASVRLFPAVVPIRSPDLWILEYLRYPANNLCLTWFWQYLLLWEQIDKQACSRCETWNIWCLKSACSPKTCMWSGKMMFPKELDLRGPGISNIQKITQSQILPWRFWLYFYVFKYVFLIACGWTFLYFSVALNMDQESACCLTNALVGTRNRIRCSLCSWR